MIDKKCVIKNLKEYRTINNLTQDDFADELGYSTKSVAKWEQGLSIPPIEVLDYLSSKLDKTINEIIGSTNNKESIYDKTLNYLLQGEVKGTIVKDEYEGNLKIEDILEGNIISLYIRVCESLLQNDNSEDEFKILNNFKSKACDDILNFWKDNQFVKYQDDQIIFTKELVLEIIQISKKYYIEEKKFMLKQAEIDKQDTDTLFKGLYQSELDYINMLKELIDKCSKFLQKNNLF